MQARWAMPPRWLAGLARSPRPGGVDLPAIIGVRLRPSTATIRQQAGSYKDKGKTAAPLRFTDMNSRSSMSM
jgi:hypothetical protein